MGLFGKKGRRAAGAHLGHLRSALPASRAHPARRHGREGDAALRAYMSRPSRCAFIWDPPQICATGRHRAIYARAVRRNVWGVYRGYMGGKNTTFYPTFGGIVAPKWRRLPPKKGGKEGYFPPMLYPLIYPIYIPADRTGIYGTMPTGCAYLGRVPNKSAPARAGHIWTKGRTALPAISARRMRPTHRQRTPEVSPMRAFGAPILRRCTALGGSNARLRRAAHRTAIAAAARTRTEGDRTPLRMA